MRIKFLLVAILLATVLCSAGSAKAANNSTLIAQLKAKIAELTAQLQTMVAQQQGTTTWCHTFNANLGIGSTSSEVGEFATALVKEGLITDFQTKFDDKFKKAVIKFQEKYGIYQTGFVGPLTRAKLNSLYGCTITASTSECATQKDCQDKYKSCVEACITMSDGHKECRGMGLLQPGQSPQVWPNCNISQ